MLEALRQQFELLKAAGGRYDEGDELEVLNIAARLRTILEGRASLVEQLCLTKRLLFADTSTHRLDPGRHPCIANLGIHIEIGVGAHWVPLRDGWPEGHPRPPDAAFATWWEEPILPQSNEDGLDRTPVFSRRQLVLAVANWDGGAHVFPRESDYDALTKDSFSFEVAFRTEAGETGFQPVRANATQACVRQIGHEVVKTLAVNLPEVIADHRRRSTVS